MLEAMYPTIIEALEDRLRLLEVKDAAHVDLHRFAGTEYERRIDEFLGEYLRPMGRK